MRLLITGGTGYLGGAIVEQAVRQEFDITMLCRKMPDERSVPPSVQIVIGDLLQPETLTAVLHHCDAVIHTAGLVSIWERNPQRFYDVNVQGTKNLLEACEKSGIQRIVYTSSFFALGPTDEKSANETWGETQRVAHTDYAKSKMEALKVVRQCMTDGMDIIPVFPVVIYGPGKETQGNHIRSMMDDFLKRKLPGTLGKGTERMTFCYVDDVAKGHLLALENAKVGSSYILGGEDTSLTDLFDLLQEITGVKRPKLKIPITVARCVAGFEELRARLSRNYMPKLTRDSLAAYQCHWRYSSLKAIQEIGYCRTPIKIGLLKTLESLGFTHPDERKTLL